MIIVDTQSGFAVSSTEKRMCACRELVCVEEIIHLKTRIFQEPQV